MKSVKVSVFQMADKRKALLAEAIRNEVAIFTSEDILTVAGIDSKEVSELIDKVSSDRKNVIGKFLKSKLKN